MLQNKLHVFVACPTIPLSMLEPSFSQHCLGFDFVIITFSHIGRQWFLRPIHTRGFAPRASSSLILHVSVHTKERFQVHSICPGSLLPNINFNRLNIVEHFAGWKFCSRGWSIPMKSLVHTEELCSWSVPLEHAPGAKSLVCIDLYMNFIRLLNITCKRTGQM